MNIEHDDLRSLLAAEYVIGTMPRLARQRFERLLKDDQQLQAEVAFWEEALADGALTQSPLDQPSEKLISRIESALGWSEQEHQKPNKSGLFGWFPLAFGGIAAACMIWLLIPMMFWQPEHSAIIQTEQKQPLWQVELSVSSGKVRVASLGYPPPVGRSDYELWWLPKEGAPVSLGVLPRLIGDFVEYDLDSLPEDGKGFAVSVEPKGGSPTSAPTGPVVFVQLLQA